MSKTIVMHVDSKAPSRVIWVNNGESILTLRVHKKQLIQAAKKMTFILFSLILGTLLMITYKNESPLFWSLAKITGILVLIYFFGNKSVNV